MIALRIAVVAAALMACTSTPHDPAARALAEDLVPLAPSVATFTMGGSATRTLRVEPAADGSAAKFVLEGGETPREIRVTRSGTSLWFSGGAGLGTELVRFGATPGTSWESGGREVRFEGWERVEVPAGAYDAARITARRGPPSLQEVETWWFAPQVGLVRLRTDHGGIFVDEMSFAGRPSGRRD